jgi:hypothetical protein
VSTKIEYPLEFHSEKPFERFNDAASHLRKIMQSWDNRLTLKGDIWRENYVFGRMALVLQYHLSRYIGRRAARPTGLEALGVFSLMLVLKANVENAHSLESWNNKMMFVPDVKVVQATQNVVPSLIGFYLVHDKVTNILSRSLFQSTTDRSYKFFPRFSEWETCRSVWRPTCCDYNLSDQDIEGAPQIMNSVTKNQGSFHVWETSFELDTKIDPQRVFLYPGAVEVRSEEVPNQSIKLIDVMVGPFDLLPT